MRPLTLMACPCDVTDQAKQALPNQAGQGSAPMLQVGRLCGGLARHRGRRAVTRPLSLLLLLLLSLLCG